MNIEQVAVIEGLARSAAALMGVESSSSKPYAVVEKLLDRVEDELSGTSHAEEMAALEASNLIKQANINKLAELSLGAVRVIRHVKDEHVVNAWLDELEKLASSLKQEEP